MQINNDNNLLIKTFFQMCKIFTTQKTNISPPCSSLYYSVVLKREPLLSDVTASGRRSPFLSFKTKIKYEGGQHPPTPQLPALKTNGDAIFPELRVCAVGCAKF